MVQLLPWAHMGWPASIATLSPSAVRLIRVNSLKGLFEHEAIINVVLDAIFLAGYAQFVLLKGMDSFNNLMAMGACAVLCCLQEFTPGSRHSINFAAATFKSWHDKFLGFISTTIREMPQLWDRWVNLRIQMLRRGCSIGGLEDINISVL
ncbi:hypothetical protein EV424DRAFT_1343371 [Suillus variegatus]|nr:hypothetical protein EV424DRAFT_1343371 [Suillus variegatus]